MIQLPKSKRDRYFDEGIPKTILETAVGFFFCFPLNSSVS